MINSNSTDPRGCVQCFQVLEKIGTIEIFKKVGNALLQNEKGCGSYIKVKPIMCWELLREDELHHIYIAQSGIFCHKQF